MSAALQFSRIDASAPGKVVLTGEYAVLAGAPALVMAVDRRARVALEPVAGSGWRVTTPGLCDGETQVSGISEVDETKSQTETNPDPLAIPRAVFGRASLPAAAGRLCIDTNELHDPSGRKLGLGSSAAACAALMTARLRLEFDDGVDREALFEQTLSAHRGFQSGRGSGVDVAAAVYGGVLTHRMHKTPASEDWPDGLHVTLLWSGQPASTTDRLRALERATSDHALAELASAAEEAAQRWRSSDCATVQTGLAGYAEALREFDQRTELGIFAAGHDRIAALAATYADVTYKPCGAGGGDLGAAFGSDPGALARFAAEIAAFGFRKLDAGRDPAGARAEILPS